MKTRIVILALALAAGSALQANSRNDPVITGTVLGAVAGGIIGNNSRNSNTWQGAAIGAGVGYVVGSLAERHSGNSGRQVVHVSSNRHDRYDRYDRYDDRSRHHSGYHNHHARHGGDRVIIHNPVRPNRCDTQVVVVQSTPRPPRSNTQVIHTGNGGTVVIIDQSPRRSCSNQTIIVRR